MNCDHQVRYPLILARTFSTSSWQLNPHPGKYDVPTRGPRPRGGTMLDHLSCHEQLRSVAHLATKEFGQTARPVTWGETYTYTSTLNLGPGEGSGEVLARVV